MSEWVNQKVGRLRNRVQKGKQLLERLSERQNQDEKLHLPFYLLLGPQTPEMDTTVSSWARDL